MELRRKTYVEQCTDELKILYLKENDTMEEEDDIENYVNLLKDMEELIVVFDAIEHSGNLADAIAEAMLKGIKYQAENDNQFISLDIRAGKLGWCLV